MGGFFRPGEITLLPAVAGDGTAAGVQRTLQRALADSSVSVVVTLGDRVASPRPRGQPGEARHRGRGHRRHLAADSADGDGASGVRRLAYVEQSYSVASTLAEFHRLIPFRKLAVVLDRNLVSAIEPGLEAGAAELVRAAGAEAVIVPAGGTAAEVLAALPAGVDAVYLTPLPAMSEAELTRLIAGLNERTLPTLSYLGRPRCRRPARSPPTSRRRTGSAGAAGRRGPPTHPRGRGRRRRCRSGWSARRGSRSISPPRG